MAVTYPLERSLQTSLFAVSLVFAILAIAALLLRVLGRTKLGIRLDWSDYIMIAATAAMIGQAVALIQAIFYGGLGFHAHEIANRFRDERGNMPFLHHLMVSRITATISLALSKISILVLCCRVFPSKRFRLMAKLTIGLIVLWAIGELVIIIKVCSPSTADWDPETDKTCGPATLSWLISGCINIVAGLVVLILPMPYIYKLQLAAYKKITLMVAFGIGFIVCIVSIIKVVLLSFVDLNDITYSIQYALLLSILETTMAIIVACIPVMRPLFKNSMAKRAAQSRYMSRNYSAAPPPKGSKAFTELRNLINGQGGSEEEPLPMRPEKTYYNRIEAVGRPSEDSHVRDDMEMGGIVVRTEFTACVEVVEVNDGPPVRNSVRDSGRGSVQHNYKI